MIAAAARVKGVASTVRCMSAVQVRAGLSGHWGVLACISLVSAGVLPDCTAQNVTSGQAQRVFRLVLAGAPCGPRGDEKPRKCLGRTSCRPAFAVATASVVA